MTMNVERCTAEKLKKKVDTVIKCKGSEKKEQKRLNRLLSANPRKVLHAKQKVRINC